MELDRMSVSTVTMTNEEWQVVLSVLREAPYKVVAPLIEKIVGQCVAQAMPQHANRTVEP